MHAEIQILRALSSKVKDVSGFFNLKMFASYSPCSNCSKELLRFVNNFNTSIKVNVDIIFDTFYLHQNYANWLGLASLCDRRQTKNEHHINLQTLCGTRNQPDSTWSMFFQEMKVEETDIGEMWDKINETERQKREDLDKYRYV